MFFSNTMAMVFKSAWTVVIANQKYLCLYDFSSKRDRQGKKLWRAFKIISVDDNKQVLLQHKKITDTLVTKFGDKSLQEPSSKYSGWLRRKSVLMKVYMATEFYKI